MIMDVLMNETLWILMSVFFVLGIIGFSILYYFLFKKTHLKTELKALFSNTPIALFFKDNKFAKMKPVTPINGVVYDDEFGAFVVSTTYVDKNTKNVLIPFDVDMGSNKNVNTKNLINKFKNVTNNEKEIEKFRTALSQNRVEQNKYINAVTSFIKFSSLRSLFNSASPHNIKSKIEKMVSKKIEEVKDAKPMQAVIVFGAIFGIIVIASILLKTMG